MALPYPIRQHNVYNMPKLTAAVQKALGAMPGSLRSLARAAHVSPALLTLIVQGKRTVTPTVATALAEALEQLGDQYHDVAAHIRQAGGRSPRRKA